MADFPDKRQFSQHTSLLAILCDAVAPAEQPALLQRVLDYPDFDEVVSSYFSFFLFKAMQKTGQEDLFFDHLDFWETFLARGHTTFGETGFASHDRSDCHAWSAHPSHFLLSLVCGIQPAAVGFHAVRIRPHLGRLTSVEASMPHPLGRIEVHYEREPGGLRATVTLPKGLSGTFEYEEKVFPLREGHNQLEGL